MRNKLLVRTFFLNAWIILTLLVFLGAEIKADESPQSAYLQDNAGVFDKHPEQQQRIEAMLQELAQKHHFHCFLLTEENLFGDSINVVARQHCATLVGARSGCIMLFEESTKNFHLSSPISVGTFSPSGEEHGPYVSAAWLEDKFLEASRDALAGTKEIEPNDYLETISGSITSLLDRQFAPQGNRHFGKTLLIITAVLLVLFLLWQSLVRRNNAELNEERLEFHFPMGTVTQRLSAKYGGGLQTTRQWMGTKPAAIDATACADFFLQGTSTTPKSRKRLIGKATIFELLCKIRDKEFTEAQVCQKYEVSPSFLAKWREHFAPQLELSNTEEMIERIKAVLATMIDDKMSDLRHMADDENGPSAEMLELIKQAITNAIHQNLPPTRLIPEHEAEETLGETDSPTAEPKSLPVMPI